MASKLKKASKKAAKTPRIDGLDPIDAEKLRKAIRQVWSWSLAPRLVRARSLGPDGFPRCENKKCESRGRPVPKSFVDHVKPIGVFDAGFIERCFRPSRELQALCKKCHDKKTKLEAQARAWGF